jgi:hypothetical protein
MHFDDDEIAEDRAVNLDLGCKEFLLRIDHRSDNTRAGIMPLASAKRPLRRRCSTCSARSAGCVGCAVADRSVPSSTNVAAARC